MEFFSKRIYKTVEFPYPIDKIRFYSNDDETTYLYMRQMYVILLDCLQKNDEKAINDLRWKPKEKNNDLESSVNLLKSVSAIMSNKNK